MGNGDYNDKEEVSNKKGESRHLNVEGPTGILQMIRNS